MIQQKKSKTGTFLALVGIAAVLILVILLENLSAIIPNCPGMPLDPSSYPAGMHTKMIIDATTPVPPEPNPRAVELLEPPAKTAEYDAIIRELLKNI